LFAAVLVSTNYKIFIGLLSGGGGRSTSDSYKIASAVIGQGMVGSAGSASYQSCVGYIPQAEVLKAQAATNLSEVYVYPSPYKPNSPDSRFYADKITFKKLTGEATIKVFTITGELAATLKKTDSFDYYEWDATNDAGQKLASGVYIYFITTPNGEKAKGKFAIIK
jgi:hypothetical protein